MTLDLESCYGTTLNYVVSYKPIWKIRNYSYYLTFLSYKSFKWTGLPEKKSMLYGCISGLTYLTAIELMDGVNQNWGFSLYDMGANIIGSGLFLSQQMLWNEQRVKLKFSFHQSDMAIYNPQLLGSNFSEQILKDYNGQTYWVSANIHSFLKIHIIEYYIFFLFKV